MHMHISIHQERDNAFVAIKEEQPSHWLKHRRVLQGAKFRAAMAAYRRAKAAWDTDELVKRSISTTHRPV